MSCQVSFEEKRGNHAHRSLLLPFNRFDENILYDVLLSNDEENIYRYVIISIRVNKIFFYIELIKKKLSEK